MNKKGSAMIKMVLYAAASLIVGAIVIVVFSGIVSKIMNNAEEEIVAQDIGLTLMALSASPNDIIYRYDKNTENYEVRITQHEVQVKSKSGYGKYEYMQMMGVVIDDALIENKLIIPFMMKAGKIVVSDEQDVYSDSCSIIPPTFGKDNIRAKIEVVETSSVAEQKLNQIKTLMTLRATDSSSKIEFVERNEDLLIVLEAGNSFEITYYENTENSENSWYRRIACYASGSLNRNEIIKKSLAPSKIGASSNEEIKISLGPSFADESSKNPEINSIIAKEIFDSIHLGIN